MAIPLRTCVGCRRVVAQTELERYVLVDGEPVADHKRRLAGRGAWLHPTDACRMLVLKRGGFSRSFRRAVAAAAVRRVVGD